MGVEIKNDSEPIAVDLKRNVRKDTLNKLLRTFGALCLGLAGCGTKLETTAPMHSQGTVLKKEHQPMVMAPVPVGKSIVQMVVRREESLITVEVPVDGVMHKKVVDLTNRAIFDDIVENEPVEVTFRAGYQVVNDSKVGTRKELRNIEVISIKKVIPKH